MSTGRMKREDGPDKGSGHRPDILSAEEAQWEIRDLSGKTSPTCLQLLAHRLTNRKLAGKKKRPHSSGAEDISAE